MHLDDEHLAVQRQGVVRQDAQQLPLRDRLEELGAACTWSRQPLVRGTLQQSPRLLVCRQAYVLVMLSQYTL